MATKGRILIVDDDPLLRPILADTLSAIGYESAAASDGVQALALLREQGDQSFDLLISDIKMPNMDGLMLLRKIRRAYPRLPVLFITGVESEATMAAAAPNGYLSKPFRIAHLESLIEKTLAARDSGRPPELPRRVLINVTEDDLRESLSETLTLGNYLPFAVSAGDEALEELKRGQFDAIISTYDDRPACGRYLNRLRQDYPDLPLVLAGSGCAAEQIKQALGRFKAAGCVQRPYQPGELIALLDRALGLDHSRSN